jgi:hypothetical protein
MCEGVGQGRSSLPYIPHTLAQVLANSTLPPALVVVEVQSKRRQRKPTLARAIQEAKKAGVNVATAILGVDGSVSLAFGEPTKPPGNELDEWIASHADPAKGH